ncbi:MAG: hypothetical protein C6Y22_05395 [Hapalosiphonaceae cyanobacterium JJU2]|nr:MAG: hypothetical protein C6Y22_05395 [Hapalosiphonaceae cyanobacterium JJU2]
MFKVSSNNPRESGNTAASSSRPNKVLRPSLPEAIVGLVVLFVVAFGVGSQLSRLGLDPVVYGLVFSFPAAVVAGLATAEIYRRSGSVWTAVVIHVVFNLPTIPVMVAAGMG